MNLEQAICGATDESNKLIPFFRGSADRITDCATSNAGGDHSVLAAPLRSRWGRRGGGHGLDVDPLRVIRGKQTTAGGGESSREGKTADSSGHCGEDEFSQDVSCSIDGRPWETGVSQELPAPLSSRVERRDSN
jgi:hypothetical protein